MPLVTIRNLLDNGVHFGHTTQHWNPKMKGFILTERCGSYILDMRETIRGIVTAVDFIRDTVARGGEVLFIGTKRQAQQVIFKQASRVGQHYIAHRWLGGLLTNFSTVSKSLVRMKELEEARLDDSVSTKKEQLIRGRELQKLRRSLGGIRNMTKLPALLWVVDTNREGIAVEEARKLGIPVVAILDSNCDPDLVQFPIPGNDDSIRSIELLTGIVADAVAQGLVERHKAPQDDIEPMAEWEKQLLQSGDSSGETRPISGTDRPLDGDLSKGPAPQDEELSD
ncbi:30S ribosomal protein S2 [Tropheryma whipplei]|uniref:30S ribosomal protein S2 n=1 Tax=Tropheryma whipplei TaxID=2039 RepID=UPI0005A7C89C|nr:30S ribosomal protein S2 [Tropheryma whipplei]